MYFVLCAFCEYTIKKLIILLYCCDWNKCIASAECLASATVIPMCIYIYVSHVYMYLCMHVRERERLRGKKLKIWDKV